MSQPEAEQPRDGEAGKPDLPRIPSNLSASSVESEELEAFTERPEPPKPGGRLSNSRRYRKNRSQSIAGETMFKDHSSHDIKLNIKLGVRYSVGHSSAREVRQLTLADFQFARKQAFPAAGTNVTPKHHSSDFKFKDYAPMAFRHIRERFGIDAADYMVSIGGDGALKELPTPGKSGALFYKTKDDRFLIKTISKEEVKYFQDALAQYYNHVMMYQDTLLPRFFQLFRIRTNRGRNIRMVVMHNILPSHLNISRRFDLKGSTLGRRTPNEKRAQPSVTLKDIDFVDVGAKIVLGPAKKRALVRQLELDCQFLQQNKLMDYSLLVGIKHVTDSVRGERRHQEGVFSEQVARRLSGPNSVSPPPSTQLYAFDGALEGQDADDKPILVYCGIIDILQEYNVRKQMEHLLKSALHSRYTISAVAPDQYANRFLDFMKSRVFF